MTDFLRGRWPSHKQIPAEITEFFIARETGWTLEYIREMDKKDYETFTLLFDIFNKISRAEDKARAKL